ncbi:MAG: phosphoribosylformylglycinamidine cyclo-ligase [Oscillospiraceae bacterium]
MKNSRSDSYASAGVDVTAGYEVVDRIKPMVKSTYTKGVIGDLGGFGGLFEPNLEGMKRPVTVSGTDGVGTKLKIAFLMDKHDTVGIDCVAMCVNDIICSGAAPMFFLDYVAMGKNIPERTAEIVSGIAEGCRQSGCALIGGETAEMPGFYPPEEYDLAGFSVGIVDYEKIINGSSIKEGDALIGVASSGVHSNGFSLVRKVFNVNEETIKEYIPELGRTLGEELLTPTRIYVKTVLKLTREKGFDIKGISHITGGGLYENVPRMFPDGLSASIDTKTFPVPPVFKLLSERGGIPARDMYNTFNMGVGLVMAVCREDVHAVTDALSECGEDAWVIGSVIKSDKGVELAW